MIPSLIAFHKQDLKQLLPYIICYIKSLDDIKNPLDSDLYQKLQTNLLTIMADQEGVLRALKLLLPDYIVRDQQETVKTLEKIYGMIAGDATINCSKMKKALSQFIIRDLKVALEQYETYLKDEVSKYKNDCKNKAQERLEIITQLSNTIYSNNDIDTIYSHVSKALKICAEKEPTWLEKPFLEQILDILSLGILPLIRWIQEDKVKSWLTNVEEGDKIYYNNKSYLIS